MAMLISAMQQDRTCIIVKADRQLLDAARSFHGLGAEDIFYVDDELAFRRDGVTCSVLTGAFLYAYKTKYLKEES